MLTYDYFSPATVDEVLDILENASEDTYIIAGGTDITLELRSKTIKPKAMVNINKINEMKHVKIKDGIIRIGSMVNFTDIERNELLNKKAKVLTEACREIGSTQIRNLGTIGGNIVTSSPAADSVAALVALDANVVLKSNSSGEREIKMVDFYDDGKPKIRKDEILFEVNFEETNNSTVTKFTRLVKRKALDIVVLSMGALIEVDDSNKCVKAKISVGAVARNPIRLYGIEKQIIGKELKMQTIESLLDDIGETVYNIILEGSPWRTESADYKSESIKGVALETFEDILLQLNIK